MELRANFTTKECEKRPLTEPFRPFSIPYDARWIDSVEIGSNAGTGVGVEIQIWEGRTPGELRFK